VDGKDQIAASDVLDFTTYDDLANAFNLNTGDSNFLVTTYPFGENTLLVFKNRSIVALQHVEGRLADVTATEVTRQVGAIGINAVVSVGPDVVYMSDRNINLVTLTSTNNSLQHKTLPLSRNIQKIFNRVNWEYAYKVSMGFLDNKLFVALPLDNATTCNTVIVYNFVTENWFGEWNFDSSLGIAIQNFVVANILACNGCMPSRRTGVFLSWVRARRIFQERRWRRFHRRSPPARIRWAIKITCRVACISIFRPGARHSPSRPTRMA
jgi:hypothetical protein